MSAKQNGFSTVQAVLLLGFFIIVVISGLLLWTIDRRGRQDTVTAPVVTEGGTVAVLGTGTASNPGPPPEEAPAPATTEPEEPAFSELPYQLNLPSGWALADSKTEADPCGGNKTWKTDTYFNGAETLIVYENGHPNGCDPAATVADVYVDFDFAQEGSSIALTNLGSIEQCTVERNPTCPKGDGKVSIFIGNESIDNPNTYTASNVNNNTYFFSITDTELDGDFNTQVGSLAALVEALLLQ